ncbi:hypothetical protein EJ08DRAFT_108868 [Tothia fuscella]|uniref:Uncharacterized protein n=1 Tax=Tothia fuscella TaxID=1048955 RepID=A0A9P4U0E5_9PEZI|nr:hypothetical protein EJ08DRAFT_108868 [Tothia fuscella]
MDWINLLPDNLSVVEGWIKTFFLFMALLTIGPWALVFLYDLLLYLWRAIHYELPIVGGRARGRARPRAPTLTERPSGNPRTLGLARISSRGEDDDVGVGTNMEERDTIKARQRHTALADGNDGS